MSETREPLWTFIRGTAKNEATGAELSLLLVIDDHHVRPCSALETKLHELLCQFVAASDLHEWGDAVTDARSLIDFGPSE